MPDELEANSVQAEQREVVYRQNNSKNDHHLHGSVVGSFYCLCHLAAPHGPGPKDFGHYDLDIRVPTARTTVRLLDEALSNWQRRPSQSTGGQT
jgi:hypothetical protein